MSTSVKKVLQIRKGQYLLGADDGAFLTTYNLDEAINISNWDLESLGWVISRLRKAGCKNIRIVSYDEGAEYRG